MLKNNKVNMIIALLAAIVLWGYVAVEINPTSTQVVRNVPIQFVNEDRLNEDGLAVLSIDQDTASVFYTGQRSKTNKLKADDFKVTVDLRGMTEGSNVATVKVTGPDGVNIDTSNLQKVVVVIEKLASIDMKIVPRVINLGSDNNEPYIVEMSRKEVRVTGAMSLIDSVSSVRAELDANSVGETVKAVSCKLVPVDKSGETVKGVALESDTISIKTLMLSKKTVDLNVDVTEDDDVVARSVILPEKITIKGDTKTLLSIDKIECESIDISDIYENCEMKLNPILPEGIEVATGSEELIAVVEVANGMKKEFTFDENDILVDNIPDGTKLVFEEKDIVVSISGLTSVVNTVTQADFKLTAEYPEDLNEGEEAVIKINVECNKVGIDNITINPEEILCKIMMLEI